jgi:hypothetical protein
MEGYGIYKWQDGRSYQGQYKDDKKHGFGIYIWADNRKYAGWWFKGKQHGLGNYAVPFENSMRFGLWEDGKRIEWFDNNAPKLLELRQLNYQDYFKNEVSA